MEKSVIRVSGLTKDFGRHRAVADLTFDVPGVQVTGFLGPNGAGKTTTMRMILGLASPTVGTSLTLGTPYSGIDRPATRVGVLLDPQTMHPKRTARDHLRWISAAAHLPQRRIAEVLGVVGLETAADRRVGEFSTGMRQRLGLAAALLGEPELLVLDEPANGLDPAGIRWLREFLRSFTASGGSVFVSSHILAEVAQVADGVVVINRGRLVTHTSVEELTSGAAGVTRVRSPQLERLRSVLAEAGGQVADDGSGVLAVRGLPTERVGGLAAEHRLVLHELAGVTQSLEDVFFELTAEEGSDA